MPGDEINLPMKQITSKSNLTMIVDSVGERSGLTWNGHLKEFSSENQVTLTRGKNLIVGGITTPEGHYVVQIYGNVGWIANGFTLFRASPNDATTSSAR
jgi:hypothetical protein